MAWISPEFLLSAYKEWKAWRQSRAHVLIEPSSRIKVYHGPHETYEVHSQLFVRFENTSGARLLAKSLHLELYLSKKWFWNRPKGLRNIDLQVPTQQIGNSVMAIREPTNFSDVDITTGVSVYSILAVHRFPEGIDSPDLGKSHRMKLRIKWVGQRDQLLTWKINGSQAIRTLDPDMYPNERESSAP